MAAALVRLRGDPEPGARPVRAALRAAFARRARPDEAAWIERIEARRVELHREERPTALPDYEAPSGNGAGGFSMSGPATSMGAASVMMSLAPQWCLLLMRLVREREPRSCLELGTGFGISASYTAAALELNGAGELTTLEGSAEWAQSAGETFAALGLGRIEQRVGPIEETLADEASRRAPLDFVFVDAEHDGDATLRHFHAILPHVADRALLVFDDAVWDGVSRAVDEIARHPRVPTTARIGRFAACVVRGPEGG
jgi:predicted O-methyltransferase YrrM